MFMGYPHGTKGYKVYDPSQNKINVSRDFKFAENAFPFRTTVNENEEARNSEIEFPYDVE